MSCTDCTYIHGWLRSLQLPGISLWSNGEFTDSVDGEVAVRKHSAHFNTSQLWWQKLPKRNHHCWDCNTTISAAQLRAAQVAPTSVQSPTETLQEEYRMCVEGDGIGKYQFIYEKLSDNQQPESPCVYMGNHHLPEPTTMCMGEPIFINLCSFDALVFVLRDIILQAGMWRYGGARERLPVMRDGLPYSLCNPLNASCSLLLVIIPAMVWLMQNIMW